MDELRTHTEPVELRDGDDGQPVAFGYAARFGTLSQDLGGFVERIEPGTFAKTIVEADIRGLFNHDSNLVLGRNKAHTLRMIEDTDGLSYEIDLPDTTAGRDVRTLLKRGDVTGSSFGFRTVADAWGETDDGYPLRTLQAVSLRDVGPVTFPAYTDAESGLRSLAEARNIDPTTVLEAAKAHLLGELLKQDLDETPEGDPTVRNTSATPRFWHFV